MAWSGIKIVTLSTQVVRYTFYNSYNGRTGGRTTDRLVKFQNLVAIHSYRAGGTRMRWHYFKAWRLLKAAVAAAGFAFSLHILTFIHSFSMSVSQPVWLCICHLVCHSFRASKRQISYAEVTVQKIITTKKANDHRGIKTIFNIYFYSFHGKKKRGHKTIATVYLLEMNLVYGQNLICL